VLLRVRGRKSDEEDTVTVGRPLGGEESAYSDEPGSFNLPLKYVSASWFYASSLTEPNQGKLGVRKQFYLP
jgi:hypothetical protein